MFYSFFLHDKFPPFSECLEPEFLSPDNIANCLSFNFKLTFFNSLIALNIKFFQVNYQKNLRVGGWNCKRKHG